MPSSREILAEPARISNEARLVAIAVPGRAIAACPPAWGSRFGCLRMGYPHFLKGTCGRTCTRRRWVSFPVRRRRSSSDLRSCFGASDPGRGVHVDRGCMMPSFRAGSARVRPARSRIRLRSTFAAISRLFASAAIGSSSGSTCGSSFRRTGATTSRPTGSSGVAASRSTRTAAAAGFAQAREAPGVAFDLGNLREAREEALQELPVKGRPGGRQAIVDPKARLPGLDEPGTAKIGQMARRRGLRNAEHLDEIAHAALAPREEREDAHPRRVRKGPEHPVGRGARTRRVHIRLHEL